MNLQDVRKQIDQLDFEMIKLLNRRMELAVTSRKFKSETVDPAREEAVMDRIRAFSHGLVAPEFGVSVFERVIAESRRLQEANHPLAGFQGEHGANSEAALNRLSPDAAAIPCETFDDVFDGVVSGYLDYGIVPVENSLGGMVSQVNELMATRPVHVVGETFLPIHHCLLSLPDTDYRDIRVVVSHPQALAQCRRFLLRHKFEGRPYYDTAGAARMLFAERPEATAVIAGPLCARLYHLEILKDNIEDHPDNVTRFLLVSAKPNRDGGNKCSVVFSCAHEAGALYRVLTLFAQADINLTRIESVPMGGRPGNYVFFLDFLGSDQDPVVRNVLDELKPLTADCRFLGCYERGDAS